MFMTHHGAMVSYGGKMKRNSHAEKPNRAWLFALLTCLVALLLPCAALGQVGAASLSGVVQDQTAALVSGATVTLTNVQNGAELTVQSNGAGSFHFAAVPSGDYRISIKMNGFRDMVRTGIHLN